MLYSKKALWLLIFLAITINAVGLFEPLLRNDDPVLYANITKEMIVSGNWIDLTFRGQDWLDKPHFPFWMTAISFKLFGINSFSYILPGFVFHLLGCFYTYKLGKKLYNYETGLIAALIYVTSLHLMLSAMDIRAEAYLLGQIMPACYYWISYDRNPKLKALLLASLFTAMAMMTKGIFVVVTIFSGLIASWIYTRQLSKIISPRWLLAYCLTLVFILPEIIALYLQFDSQPNKIVFGQTHVSGISWYFWGSQFGRFFNSGPIVNTHGNPFFFVHTYLWAFLPWSIVFVVAMYSSIRTFKQNQGSDKAKLIYLWSSFWLTFVMFSATKFQLDHYTNIIMPFAAILCANYLYKANLKTLSKVQLGLSILLLILTIGLTLYLFKTSIYSLIAILPLMVLVYILRKPALTYLEQTLIYPSLAISAAFLFVMLVNGKIYQQYDVGYNLAKIINSQPALPVFDIDANAQPLEFHLNYPYTKIGSIAELPKDFSYYFVISSDKVNNLSISAIPVGKFCGNTIDKIVRYYIDKAILKQHLDCYTVERYDHAN